MQLLNDGKLLGSNPVQGHEEHPTELPTVQLGHKFGGDLVRLHQLDGFMPSV